MHSANRIQANKLNNKTQKKSNMTVPVMHNLQNTQKQHKLGLKNPKMTPKTQKIQQKSINHANNRQNNQIISGYFINEQSYKQMRIERLNAVLFCILGVFVFVCLFSYYFVTMSEIKLNAIQKDTLAINYENEELQNKLDNLQSYYRVDETVAKTNILHKAQKTIELPAKTAPVVKFTKEKPDFVPLGSLGY